MSKRYSGRIHDPNHTREEYDLYFNELLINEPDGNLRIIRSSNVQKINDSTIEITFESAITENYIIFSTYSLTIVAVEATIGSIIGGYNSVDNTALRFGANYDVTSTNIGAPQFNEDRTKVTLTSPTYKFNTGAAYKFIAVTAN